MEKKKVFLASSSELKEERDSFARFIREINGAMKLQNIELEAEQWEFKDKAIQSHRIQDMYNETLANCEICFVLFWKKCGKYTQEELRFAYKKFKEGQNPRKIYVFFKQYDEKKSPTTLKSFRDDFSNNFDENFPIDYSDINELRYLSLLEISKYINSDVTQFRFNDHLIDFSKLPCFKNNKYYSEVLNTYKKVLAYSEKYPDDESFKKEKESYEKKLNEILADVIDTAKQINLCLATNEENTKDDNKHLVHLYRQGQFEEIIMKLNKRRPYNPHDFSRHYFCSQFP